MGLRFSRLLLSFSSFLLFAGALHAMPQLRLSSASIGPVSIAAGQVGQQQLVEAWNAGDGSLSLTATSPAPWLTANVGSSGPCATRAGSCIPIRIQLQTAGLAKGIHTAIVTIADPNASDAPQTVSVTVQMDGGVPDQLTFYAPPNGSWDQERFVTNSQLQYTVSTSGGGNWLSMATEGAGSFSFTVPYRVTARHQDGVGEGTYNGNINVTGSSFAPDIKNVPVTLQVTSQPIASILEEEIEFRVAADSVTQDKYIAVNNRGLGSLSINAITATAGDGGSWLAAERLEGTNFIKVSVNPAGLAPGPLEGSLRVETNAVNPNHDLPVRVVVEPQNRPLISYQGVVNNATFAAGEEVPQGGIVALFGDQLSFQPPTEGTEIPLVRELGGAKVFVNGQDTPIFFSSYGQINFQIPYDAQGGPAMVQVVRDGQAGNAVSVQISGRTPRILTFLGNYAIAVKPDGSYPIPSSPARPGDVLVIYAIGFGQTSPNAGTGEAATADPLQWIRPLPTVQFGGGLLPATVMPGFVGLTPGFVGLYQINVAVPGNAPKGDRIPLTVHGNGYASNQVDIAIR